MTLGDGDVSNGNRSGSMSLGAPSSVTVAAPGEGVADSSQTPGPCSQTSIRAAMQGLVGDGQAGEDSDRQEGGVRL